MTTMTWEKWTASNLVSDIIFSLSRTVRPLKTFSSLLDDESNASPIFATSGSNLRPNFEAEVIAEPDAIVLADVIVETHAIVEPVLATATDTEIDDDEVEEISDDEESPISVENNGALTEEEQVEPMLVDSVAPEDIPPVNATLDVNAENEEKSMDDESSRK
jgi:hypothetical protein